jgi:hypothetical protein
VPCLRLRLRSKRRPTIPGRTQKCLFFRSSPCETQCPSPRGNHTCCRYTTAATRSASPKSAIAKPITSRQLSGRKSAGSGRSCCVSNILLTVDRHVLGETRASVNYERELPSSRPWSLASRCSAEYQLGSPIGWRERSNSSDAIGRCNGATRLSYSLFVVESSAVGPNVKRDQEAC